MVARLKFYRIINIAFAAIVTSAFVIAMFQSLEPVARAPPVPKAETEPPRTAKPTFMGDLVRGVVYPPPLAAVAAESLPECHGEEPNHRHRVSVQALQDMLLHKELRVMIDIGAGKGHYSFMAASAGATVYSFSVHGNAMYEKSPSNRHTDWKLNDIDPRNVPYVDLMIIQEWHPYEYQRILHHCLQYCGTIRIIVIINHSAMCTDALIQLLQTKYQYTCIPEQTSYHTCHKK